MKDVNRIMTMIYLMTAIVLLYIFITDELTRMGEGKYNYYALMFCVVGMIITIGVLRKEDKSNNDEPPKVN